MASDLDAIRGLLSQCGLPSDDISGDTLDGFHVAMADRGLVGVAGIEMADNFALLRSAAVCQGFRFAGLGRRLLAACEALALDRRARALYLIANDDAAATYFTSLGYCLIDRQRVPAPLTYLAEFTHLCPQTHPCLRKIVDPRFSERLP
jgi:N-acetylglutamate synthase-like GNAT family acetyltransferase